jgi:hypothetical protein
VLTLAGLTDSAESGGVLSDDERRRLRQLEDQLGDSNVSKLERKVGSRERRPGRQPKQRKQRRSLTAWAERRFYARQLGDGRW